MKEQKLTANIITAAETDVFISFENKCKEIVIFYNII